jgi:hypothetical protein
MSIQTRATLKGYFNTGETPGETQFHNLIDSLLHVEEDSALIGLTDYSDAVNYEPGRVVLYEGRLYQANTGTTGAFNSEDWDLVPFPTKVAIFPTEHEFSGGDIGKVIGIIGAGAVPYAVVTQLAAAGVATIPVTAFEDNEFRPAVAATVGTATISLISWDAGQSSILQIINYGAGVEVVIAAGDQVPADEDVAAAALAIAAWINEEFEDVLTASASGVSIAIDTVGTGSAMNSGVLIYDDSLHTPTEVEFTEGTDGYNASKLSWINTLTEDEIEITAGVEVEPEATVEDTVDAIAAYINTELSAHFSASVTLGNLVIEYLTAGAVTGGARYETPYNAFDEEYPFEGSADASELSKMIPLGKLYAYTETTVMVEDSEFVEVTAAEDITLPETLEVGLSYPRKVRINGDGEVVAWNSGSLPFGVILTEATEAEPILVKKISPIV